jgi:hypothetical protein
MKEIRLGPQHKPTGRTRHLVGGAPIAKPSALRIVSYDGDPGFYLLYLDTEGKELTDTYHDTLEAALDQAEWEFGVTPDEWESCVGSRMEKTKSVTSSGPSTSRRGIRPCARSRIFQTTAKPSGRASASPG